MDKKMKQTSSVYKLLESEFKKINILRPMKIDRYEDGSVLSYEIESVTSNIKGKITLKIEKFIGGGFAGQVYKVELIDLDKNIEELKIGQKYALKILVPPSNFSLFFRNILYFIGFQGYFQLQSNPHASKAGALWQKLIRRGAKLKFNDENAVVDIYATLIDSTLGSCGELSQWVEGRTWRLEADSFLDLLKKWKTNKHFYSPNLGSLEYRQKYEFMHEFVALLHEMGGHEFARQYEWSTCKSQPNCLKRQGDLNNSKTGLTAVDFRAGLALLPFLPMSPGDFKLIVNGFRRGSLVQFDRGDLKKLQDFIHKNERDFNDLLPAFEELKKNDATYRNSTIDITHNHIKLLYSLTLWKTISTSTIKGWHIRNIIDKNTFENLSNNKIKILPFALLGFVPLLGNFIRKILGHELLKKHYITLLTEPKYFGKALKAKILETTLLWYRSDRISEEAVLKIIEKNDKFFFYLPLCFLPPIIHRALTDIHFLKLSLAYLIIRPVKLYFDKNMREDWLKKMVSDGREKQLVTNEDAETILNQIDEPFIQKYLKSLAVHVCTVPITQMVSVTVALVYIFMHPDLPRVQALSIGLGILAIFQITPISPGSLVRGLYVLYLVVKERNFKDYNIAVFLGFFKYIGYLAFPIQMANRYPTLARFMAGHWATEAVHFVPVFGERGALLEHGVFSLFYNYPLTLKRKIQEREEERKKTKPRYAHMPLVIFIGTLIFLFIDLFYKKGLSVPISLKSIWPLAILIPLTCGTFVSLFARGLSLNKRIVYSSLTGITMSLLSVLPFFIFTSNIPTYETVISGLWRLFVFTILTTIGAIITEIKTV